MLLQRVSSPLGETGLIVPVDNVIYLPVGLQQDEGGFRGCLMDDSGDGTGTW